MCVCIKKVLMGWGFFFLGDALMFCLLEDFVQKIREACKMI